MSCYNTKKTIIALTREEGSNDKLRSLLDGYTCVELPCIAFADGDDVDKLPAAILDNDLVIITSPQAASVFIKSWEENGKYDVKVATVGKGSSKPLLAKGIHPVFEPSDATAETLARELPTTYGMRVLYPSSSIAEKTLSTGLEERGFKVTRLSTYKTVSALWTAEQLDVAKNDVDIVTFASPSAIRMWKDKVGSDYTAVVIGPTSCRAAETSSFTRVVAPEDGSSKGLEAWAELIKETARKLI